MYFGSVSGISVTKLHAKLSHRYFSGFFFIFSQSILPGIYEVDLQHSLLRCNVLYLLGFIKFSLCFYSIFTVNVLKTAYISETSIIHFIGPFGLKILKRKFYNACYEFHCACDDFKEIVWIRRLTNKFTNIHNWQIAIDFTKRDEL